MWNYTSATPEYERINIILPATTFYSCTKNFVHTHNEAAFRWKRKKNEDEKKKKRKRKKKDKKKRSAKRTIAVRQRVGVI